VNYTGAGDADVDLLEHLAVGDRIRLRAFDTLRAVGGADVVLFGAAIR